MKLTYNHTKLSCYVGYFVQAIINNFLPLLFVLLNTSYGITYEQLGRLILLNFCTQIVVDLLSIKIIKAISYRGAALFAHATAAAGLLMLAFLPKLLSNTYLAICISIIVYAFGSGLIEVIISPIVEYLPTKENKAAGMALLHSFYCWGQLITVAVSTLLFFAFKPENRFYVAAIWAIIPLLNFFPFLKVPICEPEEEKQEGSAKILKERKFAFFIIIMLCAGASEIAVAQWSSAFAEQALHLSKYASDLLGPAAFALFMGTGRLLYGIFGNRLNIKKCITLCSLLSLICYLTIAFSKTALICLIASAICGFSVSILWPGILSTCAASYKNAGSTMFGLLAAAGDMGCSLGPWVTGFAADYLGLNLGFAVSAVFPLILFIVSLTFTLKKEK